MQYYLVRKRKYNFCLFSHQKSGTKDLQSSKRCLLRAMLEAKQKRTKTKVELCDKN